MIRIGALTGPLLGLAVAVAPLAAQDPTPSPYAGQEKRTIKALSPEDIKSLEGGEGMGLAKAAELNGYPGPKHVLELADQLGLDPGQRTAVTAIRDTMHAKALEFGGRVLAAERALEAAFAGGSATASEVESLTRAAARAWGELRVAHLQAHVSVAALLTPEQRHQYVMLRGYDHGGGDHKH